MPQRDEAWLRHQQGRWLRPDGDRWMRPDARRFLRPGCDPADAFPALAFKYNPNQPRVPAGNPDGGQWTSGGGRAAAAQGAATADASDVALPMGDIALPSGNNDYPDLFGIRPRQPDRSGLLLAGDLPEGSDPSPGTPSEEPPEIPSDRPGRSADRMKYLRAAADWLAKNAGIPGALYEGVMKGAEWMRDYRDLVQAAQDGPKPWKELMDGVGRNRRGYDRHHINEKTAARLDGFSWAQINDPSNLVSIPRLKHYQITGWYSTRNPDLGGLSPKEYLRGASWAERRRVGLEALVKFKVLAP